MVGRSRIHALEAGRSQCYWTLLSPSLDFLYVDPSLSLNLREQARLLLGKSLLAFVHPDEVESAKNDLAGVLATKVQHGSVTRVRYSRLSHIRRLLGYKGKLSASETPRDVTNDSKYMVVDIVINWAADGGKTAGSKDNTNAGGLVLCFIHGPSDLNSKDSASPKPPNWCGTANFTAEDVADLHDKLSSSLSLPSAKNTIFPIRVLQILAHNQQRSLLFSWPPAASHSLPQPSGIPSLAFGLGELAHGVNINGQAGGSDQGTSCTRRYKALQKISLPGTLSAANKKAKEMEAEVESLFIPHGKIIFACHRVAEPQETSNTSGSGSVSNTQSAPVQNPSLHEPSSSSTQNSPIGPNNNPTSEYPYPQSSPTEPMSTAIASVAHPASHSPSAASPNSPSYPHYSGYESSPNYPGAPGAPNVSLPPMNGHHPSQHAGNGAPHYNYMLPPPPPPNFSSSSNHPNQAPRAYDYTQHPQWPSNGQRGVGGSFWPDQYSPGHDGYYNVGRGGDYGKQDLPILPAPDSISAPPHDANGEHTGTDLVPPSRRREYSNGPGDTGSNGSSGGGRNRGHANRPTGVLKCSSCKATSSPEWRKGPSGRKELCNACGLRYARSKAKKEGGGGQRSKQERKRKQARTREASPGDYEEPVPASQADSNYSYETPPTSNYSGSTYSGGGTYSPVSSAYSAGSVGPGYPNGQPYPAGGSPPPQGTKRVYGQYDAGYDYEYDGRYEEGDKSKRQPVRQDGSTSPNSPVIANASGPFPFSAGRYPPNPPYTAAQKQGRYPNVPSPLSASYATPTSPRDRDGSPRHAGESFERDSASIKYEDGDDPRAKDAIAREVVLPALTALSGRH